MAPRPWNELSPEEQQKRIDGGKKGAGKRWKGHMVIPKIKRHPDDVIADRIAVTRENAIANITTTRYFSPVVCEDTGEFYLSIAEAAKALGVSRNAVWLAVSGYQTERPKCKGKRWHYATDDEKKAFAKGMNNG